MPSSILGDKFPKQKQACLPADKTKCLEKGNIGLSLIITNKREMVE